MGFDTYDGFFLQNLHGALFLGIEIDNLGFYFKGSKI